jgi:hypothetical protein
MYGCMRQVAEAVGQFDRINDVLDNVVNILLSGRRGLCDDHAVDKKVNIRIAKPTAEMDVSDGRAGGNITTLA